MNGLDRQAAIDNAKDRRIQELEAEVERLKATVDEKQADVRALNKLLQREDGWRQQAEAEARRLKWMLDEAAKELATADTEVFVYHDEERDKVLADLERRWAERKEP